MSNSTGPATLESGTDLVNHQGPPPETVAAFLRAEAREAKCPDCGGIRRRVRVEGVLYAWACCACIRADIERLHQSLGKTTAAAAGGW
jgi:hypothetical protein